MGFCESERESRALQMDDDYGRADLPGLLLHAEGGFGNEGNFTNRRCAVEVYCEREEILCGGGGMQIKAEREHPRVENDLYRTAIRHARPVKIGAPEVSVY